METIGDVLKRITPVILKEMNISKENVQEAQDLYHKVDPASRMVIIGCGLAGASLIGRAICTQKMDRRLRWAYLVCGLCFIGGASFEIYANAVNFEVIK